MAIWFNEHQTPGHSLNWRVNRVLHWEKSPYQEIQVVKGEDRYDVILTDSSGPVGEAAKLFSEEYYKLINLALNPDGMFVAQTQSPFYDGALISEVNKVMKSLFPLVRVYLGCTPTYPGGLWTFSLGSKKFDPLDAGTERLEPGDKVLFC